MPTVLNADLSKSSPLALSVLYCRLSYCKVQTKIRFYKPFAIKKLQINIFYIFIQTLEMVTQYRSYFCIEQMKLYRKKMDEQIGYRHKRYKLKSGIAGP